MSEQIRLDEEKLKTWKKVREQAIVTLKDELPTVNTDWQKAVIEKGISRLIDEKFNVASKKLEAIDKGHSFIVDMAKTAAISDKEKLITEILKKDSAGIFTEDMLKKLTVSDLTSLKNRL